MFEAAIKRDESKSIILSFLSSLKKRFVVYVNNMLEAAIKRDKSKIIKLNFLIEFIKKFNRTCKKYVGGSYMYQSG